MDRLRIPLVIFILSVLTSWSATVQADQQEPTQSVSGADVDQATAKIIEQLTELTGQPPFQVTRIYDRHGALLYEISDWGRRTIVPLSQVPPALIQATIATEDRNFYQNSGIDVRAIARAAWQNFQAGEIVSGGSTITQQLARILLLEEEERYTQSLKRKIREASLAVQLTRQYSKDEILALYLNTVYYGHQAYGVAEAARTYFNKSLSELTLAESALLAGLPQAPTRLNPYVNPEAAINRQRVVLGLMYKEGYISAAEMAAALAEELHFQSPPERGVLRLPHFVDYVRELLLERYGPVGMRQGLQVYTSIDPRYQALAETIVRAQVAQKAARHRVSNGAVVIIHPPTGQILAMVGSLDYYDESIDGQVNVTVRPRQPGSAIKPVLYAAAFESGWSPASIIWDAPVRYPLDRQRWYEPRNISGRFYGPLRLRGALANSLNVSAIRLLDAVGIERMLDTAFRLGITSWRGTTAEYGLSLAVGGYEVTLLDLTHAYATLANNGTYVPLAGITEIRDSAGRLLFQARPPEPPQQAISPAAAYQVTSVLSDPRSRQPLFGRESPLDTSRPAAVKTGTTDGWRDSLTVGYTSYLAVGVWLGNSDGRLMRDAPGYQMAGPVWHDIMEAIWADPTLHETLGYADSPLPDDFPQPADVFTAPVCDLLPGSGLNCAQGYQEVFALPGKPGNVRAILPAARINPEQRLGFCLPALQAGLPEAVMWDAVFMPLPEDPRDAKAVWNWANSRGLRLRLARECDLSPVVRPIVQPPARPAPVRLITIPDPVLAGTGGASVTVAGAVQVGRPAILGDQARVLHIRSGPGIQNPVVGYLVADKVVDVLEGPISVAQSSWFRIQVSGTDLAGWANGDYLVGVRVQREEATEAGTPEPDVMPDEAAPAITAPDAGLEVGRRARLVDGIYLLNLRTGPGIEYPVIDRVRRGDVVLIQDGSQMVAGSQWFAILDETRDVEGWVNGRFLAPLNAP